MTGQNGEPEERAQAIQDEIDEAEQLPDPTDWESYGKPGDERKDG